MCPHIQASCIYRICWIRLRMVFTCTRCIQQAVHSRCCTQYELYTVGAALGVSWLCIVGAAHAYWVGRCPGERRQSNPLTSCP